MYYFDNSATTKPLEEIVEVVQHVNLNYFANPSSAHSLGEEAKGLLNSARRQIADILVFKSDEIYFASSGTEVNNWVMQSILKALKVNHTMRNKVVISAIEHPATMKQIPMLKERGYQVEIVSVDSQGIIDLDQLKDKIDNKTLLVSTMAINNEVGSVQPLKEISELLQLEPQIIWHVDGVQAVTSQLSLLRNQRIDLLTLSGHKFHSVRGTGILAKRERVAAEPLLFGGGQESNLRSSTENLSSIVATSKALRITAEKQNETQRKLQNFREQITEALKQAGWQTFADNTASEHIICAALPNVPGEVLIHAFEEYKVYVSTTSACSSRSNQAHATLKAMGVEEKLSESAIRLSMSYTTTQAEVDYLIQTIQQVTQKIKI